MITILYVIGGLVALNFLSQTLSKPSGASNSLLDTGLFNQIFNLGKQSAAGGQQGAGKAGSLQGGGLPGGSGGGGSNAASTIQKAIQKFFTGDRSPTDYSSNILKSDLPADQASKLEDAIRNGATVGQAAITAGITEAEAVAAITGINIGNPESGIPNYNVDTVFGGPPQPSVQDVVALQHPPNDPFGGDIYSTVSFVGGDNSVGGGGGGGNTDRYPTDSWSEYW